MKSIICGIYLNSNSIHSFKSNITFKQHLIYSIHLHLRYSNNRDILSKILKEIIEMDSPREDDEADGGTLKQPAAFSYVIIIIDVVVDDMMK
jgi:hypothetical protein